MDVKEHSPTHLTMIVDSYKGFQSSLQTYPRKFFQPSRDPPPHVRNFFPDTPLTIGWRRQVQKGTNSRVLIGLDAVHTLILNVVCTCHGQSRAPPVGLSCIQQCEFVI